MKKWILNNWGNVFGVLGLIATIYVGVYYVPTHVRESLSEKDRNINIDLIQSTKELIFSDSICTIKEIKSLIEGKEVKYGIKYSYSIKELLLQTQEAFMEHKFLPLTKRKELSEEIESLKSQIKVNTNISLNEFSDGIEAISKFTKWISASIAIIVSIMAIFSFIYKYRLDEAQKEEIKNQVEIEKSKNLNSSKENALKFEESIIQALRAELKLDKNQEYTRKDSIIDYQFEYDNLMNYVFVKYLTKSKVGLGTIQSFLYELQNQNGNAILVYNTDLTTMVLKEIQTFKNDNPNINLILIKAENSKIFKQKFDRNKLQKKPRG
ncbi:hypothetical protein [Tenacibaculum xiamenense]|uniref:hypothetical protein n=1 Tax=Tenacibaculum xiamenense TaxID=1261553 RepID=UPI003894CB45